MLCTVCGKTESSQQWYKKGTLCGTCYRRQYRSKNRTKVLTNKKKSYEKNKEQHLKTTQNCKMRRIDQYRIWRRNYETKRREIPEVKILRNLRCRLWSFVKGRDRGMLDLIGCNKEELVTYLESKFQTGMTWDNYGEWHIDHIWPLSLFDFSLPINLQIACHYTNLQPLWAIDNIVKSNKTWAY